MNRTRLSILSALGCLATLEAGIFLGNWQLYSIGEPGGFAVFFSTVQLVHQHGIVHIYDPALQNVFHPLSPERHAYWYHLSYEIYLLWPLGYLPRATAFVLWVVFNSACMIAGCWFFLSRYVRLPRWELLIGACAFTPMLVMCVNAQDSGLVFFLVALAFDRWCKGSEFLSGIAIALSLFKFQYAVLIVAILGWRHRRLVAGFLTAATPLLAISFVPLGLHGCGDFRTLAQSDQFEMAPMMANLRGLVGIMFKDPFGVTVVLSAIVFVLVCWIVSSGRDRVCQFAIAVLGAWLLSYHSHWYDAVLLVIPIAIALNSVKWPIAIVLLSPIQVFRPLDTFLFTLPLLYLTYELSRAECQQKILNEAQVSAANRA